MLFELEQKSRAEEGTLTKERAQLEESRKALEDKSSEISSLKVLITSLIGRRENTLTEIKRSVKMEKYKSWFFYDEWLEANIEGMHHYLELYRRPNTMD